MVATVQEAYWKGWKTEERRRVVRAVIARVTDWVKGTIRMNRDIGGRDSWMFDGKD